MTLRAVLFDLWGTLITDPPERGRPRQVWRAGQVLDALANHDLRLEFDVVDRALLSAMAALAELQDSGCDVDSAGRVTIFSEALVKACGEPVPVDAVDAVERAVTGMPAEFRPGLATGAAETLAAVKNAGLATALVSNAGFTNATALRQLLGGYDLTRYFDVLVFSDELQVAKPDARMFERALEALGVSPDAAAYVGDSPHNDVFGAQQAGILAVQIGSRTRDGITPDARIDRLDELMDVLRTQGLLEAADPSSGRAEAREIETPRQPVS
jgi:HAD superfamily hydrolase (TIGR01509 family)